MKNVLVCLILSLVVLTGCTPKQANEGVPDTIQIIEKNEQEIDNGIEDDMDEAAGLYDLGAITINANGTEPFWGFSASGTNLVWTQPSFAGPITTTPYVVTMTQTPTTITITGAGINTLLTLQACSDGMSDLVYTHEVVATVGVEVFNGCANISL